MSKKEKIIVVALAIVFVAVTLGMVWDLFGKNYLSKKSLVIQNQPPGEAITACKSKSSGDSCEFSDKGQTVQGVCNTNPGILACAPNNKNGSEVTPSGQTKKKDTNTSTTLSTDASSCINNTKDNPQCKDCCDCLSGADSAARTTCRNTCATHDFTKNSNFITVTAPSSLGKNRDYSVALGQSTSNACKVYCENSMSLQCGDYKHCRMACDNKWGIEPGPGGND